MIWVNEEQVRAIHSRVIAVSGGIDGLRDPSGLEAAITAPLQTFGGQELFPTPLEKIARLGYGLAANHAFLDGNKRIGAMMTQLMMKWNGFPLHLETGELSERFISIAAGSSGEEELLAWLKAHME